MSSLTVESPISLALCEWVEQVDRLVLVCDRRETIVFANAAARRWFGGDRLLIGTPLDSVLTRSQSIAHGSASESKPVRFESKQPLAGPLDAEILRSDGFLVLCMRGSARPDPTPSLDGPAAEELVAQISHEIRNPLASVSTSLEMLSTSLNGEGRERCRRLRVEIERVTTLLKNVSDLYRPPLPRQGLCRSSFGRVLRQCLSLFEPLWTARGITVDLDLADLNAEVPLDSNRLTSVLQNLILNSLQAMQDGGVLRLHAQRTADELVVRIEDTGSGIDAEHLEDVFRPFWSMRAGGTGLGLTVARRFMEECGGRLTLESQRGEGTSVTLVFPAQPGGESTE